MNSLLETIPQLLSYQNSILAFTILCFSVLIQNLLTAPLAFLKNEQAPGMPLNGNHKLLSFRVLRTHSNSVESLPAFGFIFIIAIIIGVKPTLVNWLVSIHLISRIIFWVVYYSGIGKVAGGIRTLSFVGGLSTNIILAVACFHQFSNL